jgi:hypothetical protein
MWHAYSTSRSVIHDVLHVCMLQVFQPSAEALQGWSPSQPNGYSGGHGMLAANGAQSLP